MIDLSKAYAGQIATLINGESDILLKAEVLNEDKGIFEVFFRNRKGKFGFIYNNDGTKHRDYSPYPNIVSLSDPIQVQVARLEGEIKGLEYFYEYAMSNDVQMRSTLLIKINQLKNELLTLQNNQ